MAAQPPPRPAIPPTAADPARGKFMELVPHYQIFVIEGATGSGKSTQIPKWLYDNAMDGRVQRPFNGIITQPRRMAATGLAERLSFELGYPESSIGGISNPVGYQIGFDRRMHLMHTHLLFVTTGVLIQELKNRDANFGRYTHILIDEIHERDIHMDVLLIILKRILMDRFRSGSRTVKIFMLSATMDATPLLNYFNTTTTITPAAANELRRTRPEQNCQVRMLNNAVHFVIHVPDATQNHRVDIDYNEDFEPLTVGRPPRQREVPGISYQMYAYALSVLRQLEIKDLAVEVKGSVLVFLPGILEINTMLAKLEAEMEQNGYRWKIIVVHGSTSNAEQAEVYKIFQRQRKIVLSTNVCESSLTVTDIIHVIDFSLCRNLVKDHNYNINMLKLEWASKDQCNQRKGRVGRVQNGFYYSCLSFKRFMELNEHKTPELLRVCIVIPILQLKIFEPNESPRRILDVALDSPSINAIHSGVNILKLLGALKHSVDPVDGGLTLFGSWIGKIPIEPRFGKLIYMGYVLGVLDECIALACCLSFTYYPIKIPANGNARVQLHHALLELDGGNFSDHILLITIFFILRRYRVNGGNEETARQGLVESEFCAKHCLNKRVFKMAAQKYDQIEAQLVHDDVRRLYRTLNQNFSDAQRNILIKCAVAAAFIPAGFSSTFGVGARRPELFKYEADPVTGCSSKRFYDLKRTLTYFDIDFNMTSSDEVVSREMSRFFEDKHLPEESIDLVVAERKANVVFSINYPRYMGFALPLFMLHRYQQVHLGEIDIDEMGEPILNYIPVGQPGHNPQVEQYPFDTRTVAKGPHNPVELKYQPLINSPASHQALVDGSSVCCVTFDPNYNQILELDKSRPFLLIGSELSFTNTNSAVYRNGQIKTQGNTLYHEFEGQFELMLLLFGARIQLYSTRPVSMNQIVKDFRDKNGLPAYGTGFIPENSEIRGRPIGLKSFLVGLGNGSAEKWDIKKTCDFELTWGDMEKIKALRSQMNQAALPREISPQLFNALRNDILGLLTRTRARIINPEEPQDLTWTSLSAAAIEQEDNYPFFPM